jgi:hypothetical protein
MGPPEAGCAGGGPGGAEDADGPAAAAVGAASAKLPTPFSLRSPPRRRRRRRGQSWHAVDSLADLSIPLSAEQAVKRGVQEAWKLAGLALQLWSYLGLGASSS